MNAAYLSDLIVMLGSAVVWVPLFRALGLGAVPGFLMAGVFVGPSVAGWISNADEISHIAEFGVVLLLFMIGVELRPARFWLMRRWVFGLGTAQVLATSALLSAATVLLFHIPLRVALVVGSALALSSTAFVVTLLAEQRLLASEYGRASFGVLLLQDLAVMPLLALTAILSLPGASAAREFPAAMARAAGIIAVLLVAGHYLVNPLLGRVARAKSPEIFTASAVLLVAGAAAVTDLGGLSMGLGAFVAGMLVAESAYRHQLIAELQPFRGLLIGLFFMSMGMSLDLAQLAAHPLLSAALVAGLIALKVAVLWPLARGFGLATPADVAVSLVLAQSGEFALVVFALARRTNLMTEPLYQQGLLVVLLSMLATPALAWAAVRLNRRRRPVIAAEPPSGEDAGPPVVIAGFGRVGRRVGQVLGRTATPYVAIDGDSDVVAAARAAGLPAFYGDASDATVLASAGSGDAKVIVVALDDPDAAEKLVDALRLAHPAATIIVRARDAEHSRKLFQHGADFVVSENFEASVDLARMALRGVHGHDPRLDAILERYRDEYYAAIRRPGFDAGQEDAARTTGQDPAAPAANR